MIPYIERSHAYYAAQGYAPYQWAAHDSSPFHTLDKPLAEARLALVTTAAPLKQDVGDQGPGAAYNAEAKFFEVFCRPVDPPPDLRISHIGYDRAHCRADDPNTWLPIAALQRAQQKGIYHELCEELIGAPTNRSQRVTNTTDAPAVLEHCRRLRAEVALLVPT